MIYKLFTTLIIFIHFLFIIYVLFGAFLGMKWPKSLFVHLPSFFWGAYIELSGGVCPLTPLENWLRIKGGNISYAGDFIEHYVENLVYPPGLTRKIQIIFGIIVIVINIAVYFYIYRRRKMLSNYTARHPDGKI